VGEELLPLRPHVGLSRVSRAGGSKRGERIGYRRVTVGLIHLIA
jgi:hypothetical protein